MLWHWSIFLAHWPGCEHLPPSIWSLPPSRPACGIAAGCADRPAGGCLVTASSDCCKWWHEGHFLLSGVSPQWSLACHRHVDSWSPGTFYSLPGMVSSRSSWATRLVSLSGVKPHAMAVILQVKPKPRLWFHKHVLAYRIISGRKAMTGSTQLGFNSWAAGLRWSRAGCRKQQRGFSLGDRVLLKLRQHFGCAFSVKALYIYRMNYSNLISAGFINFLV